MLHWAWYMWYYMCSVDDGAVRVWRNYCREGQDGADLVTAWQSVSDMLPSNRGQSVHRYNTEQGETRDSGSWDLKLFHLTMPFILILAIVTPLIFSIYKYPPILGPSPI